MLYAAISILSVTSGLTLGTAYTEAAAVAPLAISSSSAVGFPVVTPPAISLALGGRSTVLLEPMSFVKENFPLMIRQQGYKVTVRWKKFKAVKYSFILHSDKKVVRSTKRCKVSFKTKPGIKYSLLEFMGMEALL